MIENGVMKLKRFSQKINKILQHKNYHRKQLPSQKKTFQLFFSLLSQSLSKKLM